VRTNAGWGLERFDCEPAAEKNQLIFPNFSILSNRADLSPHCFLHECVCIGAMQSTRLFCNKDLRKIHRCTTPLAAGIRFMEVQPTIEKEGGVVR
jgi:hypothetical protein